MFVCQKCHQNSQPNERPTRVILAVRQKEKESGSEIAAEANWCPSCAGPELAVAPLLPYKH